MASLNSFDFTGRLGRDPELRTISGDKQVCNLTVAIDTYGDKPTLWIDLSVWGAGAENCAKYLAKGREIAVHGQIDELHVFEKKDGTQGSSLRVSTRDVSFIGPRGDTQQTIPASDVPSDFAPATSSSGSDDSEDIPFAWEGTRDYDERRVHNCRPF
jgi:single-strand DNA-binding protein